MGDLELPTEQLRARTSVSSRAFAFGVEENDSFRVIGKVALPDVGSDFILVFAPTKDGYHAFPVRADDPDFRGNDTLAFNFSTQQARHHARHRQADHRPVWKLPPPPPFPADATFYQALFTYEKEGKFIPFNNTRWPVNSNTRLCFSSSRSHRPESSPTVPSHNSQHPKWPRAPRNRKTEAMYRRINGLIWLRNPDME